jgi:hypothetical protein
VLQTHGFDSIHDDNRRYDPVGVEVAEQTRRVDSDDGAGTKSAVLIAGVDVAGGTPVADVDDAQVAAWLESSLEDFHVDRGVLTESHADFVDDGSVAEDDNMAEFVEVLAEDLHPVQQVDGLLRSLVICARRPSSVAAEVERERVVAVKSLDSLPVSVAADRKRSRHTQETSRGPLQPPLFTTQDRTSIGRGGRD